MNEAQRLETAGETALATKLYVDVIRQAAGNNAAQTALMRIAKSLFADAIRARDNSDTDEAIRLLVQSIQLEPHSDETRDELKRLLSMMPERDVTQDCLIFPDAARATEFYGNAIRTAIEFCTYGGIIGNVYEFGVLAGWTARLFSERMRDTQFLGDLYLFDSFSGLPRQKDAVDSASYDVTRGVWQSEMELPQSYLAELGMPIEAHIKRMLSRVIDADRIHIRKGYYSESLREPLTGKAAIVHLDCDLYQSTVEVLDALKRDDVLQDGTVLMFDDWNCNRGNPAFGQRRALREFIEQGQDRYAVSDYFSYGFNCTAFILHDFATVPESLRPDKSRFRSKTAGRAIARLFSS